ncbi:SET domain-containing protein RMS1 [Paraphoma chrysanthemicola]|uniref:SET domain-containing protein RMS1 n=1 Tax=Paraphoma chrysanthemicola TaxID=798071 RepID=A0A8K0QVS5_9PLEO|nr:SET domain-containing protein RMS1 [Paraphoma chrysanthemicola]
MDDFQAATERFLTWFKSMGGEFRDDLLEIKDFRSRDAGRGIVAVKDIPEDTKLFSIPRDAIINTETSNLTEKLPGVFDLPDDNDDNDIGQHDPWTSLILVMLYEYLQGDASRWKPYFDVLPQTFDTPLFWSETELRELQGTCLTAEKIGKQEGDDMLRKRVVKTVQANPKIFFPAGAALLNEDELLVLAHRMGSTVMAYAFDLDNANDESEDEEDGWVEDRDETTMLGMVPMADLLNANAEFNAHVNHGESLEVTSLRAELKAGAEILNYYGPLPSSELLRRYGYATAEHRRYDVIELPWSLVRLALAQHFKIDEGKVPRLEDTEDYFIIERDSGDPDSEGRLTYEPKLREISTDLNEQLAGTLKALKRWKPDAFLGKRQRDEICNVIIKEALMAKLKQYPTTIQEDEGLLKGGGATKRQNMAIEVRLGEKLLLQEALALLQDATKAVEKASGEPASKRAKTKA